MTDVRWTVEDLALAGLQAATYNGSLSASDTYLVNLGGDGVTFLHFKKSGAGACTVTMDTPITIAGQDVANPTIEVIATSGDTFVRLSPESILRDSSHDARITLSEITGLTVAVLRLN